MIKYGLLTRFNAAIEAAQAGEHGRGFAVVADEIRKLAEDTKRSILTITSLLDNIRNSTSETVQSIGNINQATSESTLLIEEMLTDIQQITQKVAMINHQIQNVAAATQEQTAGSEQVSAAMNEIESVSRLTLAALDKVKTRIADLTDFISLTDAALENTRQASLKWHYYELRENMRLRQIEHEKWVENLRNRQSVEFDPTRCNFGRFYYGYEPNIPELKEVYRRFEKPHRQLHESGGQFLQLIQTGQEEAAQRTLIEVEKHYQDIKEIFNEFYRVIERLFEQGTTMF